MRLKMALWQLHAVLYTKVFHLHYSYVETSEPSIARNPVELEQKKSFAGKYPVFQQQTEQKMERNGWYLEHERDPSGLVQQETELVIMSSGTVEQERVILRKLVEQEMQQERDFSGLDQQRPEQEIESSGLVQQENTELNGEHQKPNMDIFSTEPSTSQSVTHLPNKAPVKVRLYVYCCI